MQKLPQLPMHSTGDSKSPPCLSVVPSVSSWKQSRTEQLVRCLGHPQDMVSGKEAVGSLEVEA